MRYLYTFAACIAAQTESLKPANYSKNRYAYVLENDESILYLEGSFSEKAVNTNNFSISTERVDKPEFNLPLPGSAITTSIYYGNDHRYIGASSQKINGGKLTELKTISIAQTTLISSLKHLFF